MPVLEAVKSEKWGAGRPTVVTFIHILSSPPGLPPKLANIQNGRQTDSESNAKSK